MALTLLSPVLVWAAPTFIRCGGVGGLACVNGLGRVQGCSGDGQCAAGEICVSDGDAGTPGCGTGFSQCMRACTTTTTIAVNPVLVHFTTTDDWNGKYHIITTNETFDLAGAGIGNLIEVASHTFSNGTLVEVEFLTAGSAHLCNDPGQSINYPWSVSTQDTCTPVNNDVFRAHVTLNAAESADASIFFVPHS